MPTFEKIDTGVERRQRVLAIERDLWDRLQ